MSIPSLENIPLNYMIPSTKGKSNIVQSDIRDTAKALKTNNTEKIQKTIDKIQKHISENIELSDDAIKELEYCRGLLLLKQNKTTDGEQALTKANCWWSKYILKNIKDIQTPTAPPTIINPDDVKSSKSLSHFYIDDLCNYGEFVSHLSQDNPDYTIQFPISYYFEAISHAIEYFPDTKSYNDFLGKLNSSLEQHIMTQKDVEAYPHWGLNVEINEQYKVLSNKLKQNPAFHEAFKKSFVLGKPPIDSKSAYIVMYLDFIPALGDQHSDSCTVLINMIDKLAPIEKTGGKGSKYTPVDLLLEYIEKKTPDSTPQTKLAIAQSLLKLGDRLRIQSEQRVVITDNDRRYIKSQARSLFERAELLGNKDAIFYNTILSIQLGEISFLEALKQLKEAAINESPSARFLLSKKVCEAILKTVNKSDQNNVPEDEPWTALTDEIFKKENEEVVADLVKKIKQRLGTMIQEAPQSTWRGKTVRWFKGAFGIILGAIQEYWQQTLVGVLATGAIAAIITCLCLFAPAVATKGITIALILFLITGGGACACHDR